ncbi:STAS domain-containing protein [Pelosinus sp. sgz500959]|uniref:STAS domain-containing protein n=1 Tax=Pelosinus sp. sgz500959 TaxID=3242472 RepID=UPI003672D633
MEKQITIDENRILIKLNGRMYLEDSVILRQELLGYLDEKYNKCIVDMSAVNYIDASGIGTLVALRNQSHCLGGSLKVAGLKGIVKELFKITRFEESFTE